MLRDGLCHAAEQVPADAGDEQAGSVDGGSSASSTDAKAQAASAVEAGGSKAKAKEAAAQEHDAAVADRMSGDGGPRSANEKSPGKASVCGNGVRERMELCDGDDCMTECKSDNACILSQLEGAAKTCDAHCNTTEIAACEGGDGCCPSGCDHGTDSDCSPSCGDGLLTDNETCEPGSSEHPCPTRVTCDDSDPCTEDMVTGSAQQCSAKCAHTPIVTAKNGDRCCPSNANANTDDDCTATCGNNVVEAGEKCDGDCPTSCSVMARCSKSKLVGLATQCSAQCVALTIATKVDDDGCCPSGANANNDSDCSPICGNSVREAGEACDGDCPTSCAPAVGCSREALVGSGCAAACVSSTITTAMSNDGCCPVGADSRNDNDCKAAPFCGDGKVNAPGETCDGNCPTDPVRDCGARGPCEYFKLGGSLCDVRCVPWNTATDGNIDRERWSHCQSWCQQNCSRTNLTADEKKSCAENGFPSGTP